MLATLRRLWSRRRASASITMGVHVAVVPKPIPLVDEVPGDVAWYGFWHCDENTWHWQKLGAPRHWHSHWLPTTAELLPARCCPPEVE